MLNTIKTGYDGAVNKFSKALPMLQTIPENIKRTAQEIRFSISKPVMIKTNKGYFNLQLIADEQLIESIISCVFEHSVHSFEEEISNGYITINGGHRVGFSGTAVYKNNKVSFIKNISSINIRIANEHFGVAEKLLRIFENNEPSGILITGKACSGKTTILRELCRNIGSEYRLSIIDERGEIAGCVNGVPSFDTGILSDIYNGFYKSDGITRAIRTMSPDFIVFDELSFDTDLLDICTSSGCKIIMTVHSFSISDFYNNAKIHEILEKGIISHICFIDEITKTINEIKEV